MKRVRRVKIGGMLAAVLLFSLLAGGPVAAKSKVVELKDARYNVNFSLTDNLKGFMGKKVFIHLRSGETLAGFVKAVGNHLVHLEKLERKDYFDALIRLEDISAIDTRFREVQR